MGTRLVIREKIMIVCAKFILSNWKSRYLMLHESRCPTMLEILLPMLLPMLLLLRGPVL